MKTKTFHFSIARTIEIIVSTPHNSGHTVLGDTKLGQAGLLGGQLATTVSIIIFSPPLFSHRPMLKSKHLYCKTLSERPQT